MGAPRNVGKHLEKTLRRNRLLASVRAGKTVAEAAEAEGISARNAGSMINAALRELARQNLDLAEHVRDIEVARLDEMHAQLWPLIHAPGPVPLKAYDRLLKIGERRAKLLGLDAPAKVAVSGTVEHTHELVDDDERERLERAWRRVDAEAEVVALGPGD